MELNADAVDARRERRTLRTLCWRLGLRGGMVMGGEASLGMMVVVVFVLLDRRRDGCGEADVETRVLATLEGVVGREAVLVVVGGDAGVLGGW
jgi:hypothetical protein